MQFFRKSWYSTEINVNFIKNMFWDNIFIEFLQTDKHFIYFGQDLDTVAYAFKTILSSH